MTRVRETHFNVDNQCANRRNPIVTGTITDLRGELADATDLAAGIQRQLEGLQNARQGDTSLENELGRIINQLKRSSKFNTRHGRTTVAGPSIVHV